MRTDMADINADDKMMDLLQCDLLARNYAALASTDELPALGILEGQDQISGIANQYMACKVRDANLSKKLKDTKPDFNELIAANDLFSLFDTEPVTASNDKEYKDFQEKICPGFQKFVEDDLKSSCRITLFGKKHCRAKALNASKSRHGRLLKRYYEKNPEAKDLNDLISLKTQKLNVREMINKTNEGSQNKEVVRVYDNTIKPTLTNRSIYNTENIFRPSASGSSSSSPNKVADDKSGSSSDSDASIFKTVNKAQESYSNSSYANGSGKPGSPDSSIGNNPSGNSTNSNSDSSSTDNSISQGGSVNPGQVIPSFLNDSPVAPVTPAVDAKETTKIVSVDDVEDVIDDLDKLPADKRADYIQQSKNFLAQQNQSSEQIIDLNKKIAALENPGISRSIASSNVFIPNKTLGGGNLNQTTSPIVNKMNNSQVVGGTKISNNSMDKSAVSYKKALNQMNDKSDNSAEKIVVDDKSVFEFKGPINKSELPGDILVGVPLTPDSELFAQLSVAGAGNEHGEALKAYLAENLKSKEIPANQIISIKCTGQGCTRDNEMLLHISKDANNNLIIRSVAKDTLVTRSSANIDEFYNTIDLETKTKHKRHKKVKQ